MRAWEGYWDDTVMRLGGSVYGSQTTKGDVGRCCKELRDQGMKEG